MFRKKIIQEKITIEYRKIRKPKKNEFLLFSVPPDTTRAFIHQFSDILNRSIKEGHKYIIIPKSITITPIKLTKYNWKLRYENRR